MHISNLTLAAFVLGATSFAPGCGGDNTGIVDDEADFNQLDTGDAKTDALSAKFKLLGTLSYGDTSDSVSYKNPPKYLAYKFMGVEGDEVSVTVQSDDGVASVWILDGKKQILDQVDGAKAIESAGSMALSTVTLPASTLKTHYIVFREKSLKAASFTVSLTSKKKKDFFSCKVDSDCVAVAEAACCHNGRNAAVNKHMTDEYAASVTCSGNEICPLFLILDKRVAQCDTGAGKCQMVNPEDVRCGGFTTNPHKCAAGYTCDSTGMNPDVPGICKQACVQNVLCVQGSHFDHDQCKCVADDCTVTGCAAGQKCEACWGHMACIPEHALC